LPEGFRLEPVLGGLTDPSALDRTPDGRILIAERTTGNVRVVNYGTLDAAPLCTVGVNATGEGGLLGLAVHPDFESNGWLYLYYTSSSSNVNKVTRVTIAGGTCSGEIDILADLGAGGNFLRNGGGIAFGPDGRLYVAVGDMEDAGNAQDDLVLQGKVLRVEDTGGAPEIFAKGIRDGRGIDVRATGDVLMTDAGDDPTAVADELNPVPPGGNLGWDVATGDVDPLASWLPTIGIEGMSVYAASAFPDLIADGLDNDHDAFGPDGQPGRARKDDNGAGECVGGTNNSGPCTFDSDCPPRSGEITYCQSSDEMAEYCPGGSPLQDDICGDTGAAGVDEPDESYLNSLFMASGDRVVRWVDGIADPDPGWSTFLDSTALPDCPTGWTDAMEGGDGFLYLVATNGGGAGGALYRVIYDTQPGPREVSASGSHFPFLIEKGAGGELVLYWEDLRDDALQPRDNGSVPLAGVREYTVWQGDIGTWYSHSPIAGLGATPGVAVNDAVRTVTLTSSPDDVYFLVSGRHDNLEGTLGTGQSERPGYAVTDLCDVIDYHSSPSWNLWQCGQDFTLLDELGHTRSLYEFRGKAIMLDLSAVWCVPCNIEADVLEGLHQDYRDRGVQVLTVLMDDAQGNYEGRPNPPECRQWSDRSEGLEDHTFPCISDPNPASGPQQAWPKYDAHNAVPTNVVLDQGLRVVFTTGGYPATTIRDLLDALVGATDVCLH
jgi:thiol-disulfide isomerase/thioredoxin